MSHWKKQLTIVECQNQILFLILTHAWPLLVFLFLTRDTAFFPFHFCFSLNPRLKPWHAPYPFLFWFSLNACLNPRHQLSSLLLHLFPATRAPLSLNLLEAQVHPKHLDSKLEPEREAKSRCYHLVSLLVVGQSILFFMGLSL